MIKKEKCIQLKIDQLIGNISSKIYEKIDSKEEIKDIITLVYFNHCLDLFDFMKNYYKIQKNEILFHIAIIYDMLGYNSRSLEFVNKSLNIISNVPTIILFKSSLYASMDKIEEAQKYLLKFKYLIGEDKYLNYIYNCIRVIYLYLSEYEENILLGEINIIETKYPNFYCNNIAIFSIKSKLLQKLSEKIKNIDKKRSQFYQKESLQNKKNAFNNGEIKANYLFKKEIIKEDATKLLLIIYPDIIEYKPKALVDYNFNFHNGFGLFFTLIKLCKIFKFKIQIKTFKKMNKNLNFKNYSINDIIDLIIINNKKLYQNDNTSNSGNSNDDIKEYYESIINLSKNVFLENFINNKNDSLYKPIKNNSIKRLKQGENIKYIENNNNDINDINYKIRTNYFIYKGYYSKMNLNENIIKKIDYNQEYKEKKGNDTLLNEMDEEFKDIMKENKSNDDILLEKSFIEDNKTINPEKKYNKDLNNIKKNEYKVKLIQSTQKKSNKFLNKNINNKYIRRNKNINIENIALKLQKKNINNNCKEKSKEEKGKKDSHLYIDNVKLNKIKNIGINIINIFNNINKYDIYNIHTSRENTKLQLNKINKKINENINKTERVNIIEKKSFNRTLKKSINKIKFKDNSIEKNNINNKTSKLNNEKNENNENNDTPKEKNIIKIRTKNDNLKDVYKIFIKNLKKNEYYKRNNTKEIKKKNNQTQITVNQVYKNLDNTTLTRFNTITQKIKNKNTRVKNIPKPLKLEINKKNFNSERNPFNTINISEYSKIKKITDFKIYNNYSNKNLNKIIKENLINNRNNLKFNTIEENQKSEFKKRNDLFINKKFNFHTININLFLKGKVNTPKYQKMSFLTSFQSESSNIKRGSSTSKFLFPKFGLNNPKYKIGLKKRVKIN